ncbi:hypothetical protein ACFZCV_05410 [Streptomyces sp. NPDC007920]|uniref:hypothetical protein n=1 Tax=Streptomyces sp. NPDC007920 TaxID=3364794 RepID=UPI0036EA7EBA
MNDSETLTRAPYAEILCVGGTLTVSTAPGTPPVELAAVPPSLCTDLVEVLAYCARPRKPEEILMFLSDLGRTAESAAELVAACLEHGLLTSQTVTCIGTAAPTAPIGEFDTDRFLALRRARRYADYRDDSVFDMDRALMEQLLAVSPPPSPETVFEGPRIPLPHPAVHRPDSLLNAVSAMVFAGFGRLRPATFLDVLDVHLKPVPSDGARHPFDAYLRVPPGQAIPAGTYGYLPSAHSLVSVPPASPDDNAPGVFTLHIKAVFERSQWRYRQGIAYESLALDYGHAMATMRAVANESGLRITPSAHGCPVVADQPLVTETVTQIDLLQEERC